jgi:hypothetical protein
LKEEVPGRWSNRYLHSDLDDVTATRKRGTRWGLYKKLDGLVQHLRRVASYACGEMRAFFHRRSRLWSTFFKDGVIRGSLHLAAANAISALLSSDARATGPHNGARNSPGQRKHWKNHRKTPATFSSDNSRHFLLDIERKRERER